MLARKNKRSLLGLFSTFEDQLNSKHPLYILAHKIDWQELEEKLSPLYSLNGRPAKAIRLMCGLLILKHVRNLSDESIVEQFAENAYYQYFCGYMQFEPNFPCASSELVHFRKRIGKDGLELILQQSIRVNDDDQPESGDRIAYIDSTVQEKNITYPTDTKLQIKIVEKCWKIAKNNHLQLRQSYSRIMKKLRRISRFDKSPKAQKKVRAARRKIKTIAGRLVRDLARKLPIHHPQQHDLTFFIKVLKQKRTDSNKIYSLHEREIQCISKGKEHKKYEFGNKVSIIYADRGVILAAQSFRNEYDGHTIEKSLEQLERISGTTLKTLVGDRGYKGKSIIRETEIVIPKLPLKRDSRYKGKKRKKLLQRRASIEPVIAHLKSEHRLCRNFYKGVIGDYVNLLLAAAAFNFKRAMRALFWLVIRQLQTIATALKSRYIHFENSL